MMQGTFKLDPAATLTVRMRRQEENNTGYPLVINPQKQEVILSRGKNRFGRGIDSMPSSPSRCKPLSRARSSSVSSTGRKPSRPEPNYSHGDLSFEVDGGAAEILDLTVKTLPQKTGPMN
jgi:hypothetical protein